MKKLKILILLLYAGTTAWGQNKLVEYEYWFNNDYANKQIVAVSSNALHQLNTDFDVSSFPDGVNIFNIRYKDENGGDSSTLSKSFVKFNPAASAQNKLVGYEYWFNNDYANKQAVAVSPIASHQVNADFNVSLFPNGVNILNIRYKDENGKFSSTLSKAFVKFNPPASIQNKLVEYEYWFNNDYANKQTVAISPIASHQVNADFDVSLFPNGVNVFNIRYKDENGKYSSILSKAFVKQPSSFSGNKLIEYRYWIDNDIASAVSLSLLHSQQVNLIENLNLSQLPKGTHELNYQFKDSLGMWSAVIVNNFQKISFPIADYSYNTVSNCDSTTVQFTDLSIDGDTYFWNFGDGTTDTTATPTHNYYTPGSYLVSLTVTDTLTLADSTYQTTLFVTGNTAHSFALSACDSYTSPSGNYVYKTSGIYYDTIPNQWGCDSLLTINVTINTVNTDVIQNSATLTANATGATYQWMDCDNDYSIINGETGQSFTATQNGSYAVKVTQNGCTDTSACYTVTTVGILENTFSNDITVYPNPTNGIVKIDLGETLSEFVVSIIDVNGKLIRQSTYKNTKMFELNLNVQSGIYLLTINSGNKKATIRLIKN